MNLKVLLLEDDVSHALELEEGFVKRAWEVTTRADADDAVGVATSDHFDLILLSADLTGANGFELCNRIKSEPTSAGVPVYLMSSAVSHADFAEQQRRGSKAEGFFKKPILVDDLLARLHSEPPAFLSEPPPPVGFPVEELGTGDLQSIDSAGDRAGANTKEGGDGNADITDEHLAGDVADLADVEDYDSLQGAPPRIAPPPPPPVPPRLPSPSSPALRAPSSPALRAPSSPSSPSLPSSSPSSPSLPAAAQSGSPPAANRALLEQREALHKLERTIGTLRSDLATKNQSIAKSDEKRRALEAELIELRKKTREEIDQVNEAAALYDVEKTNDAARHARELAELSARHDLVEQALVQEMAAREAAHGAALAAEAQRFAQLEASIADRERRHADLLEKRDFEQDEAIAAAEQAAAGEMAVSAQRLASEREARAADVAAHARALAEAHEQKAVAIVAIERASAAALEERGRAHAAELQELARASAATLSQALEERDRAHAELLATAEKAHSEAIAALAKQLARSEHALATEREVREADAAEATARAAEAKTHADAREAEARAEAAEANARAAASAAEAQSSAADAKAQAEASAIERELRAADAKAHELALTNEREARAAEAKANEVALAAEREARAADRQTHEEALAAVNEAREVEAQSHTVSLTSEREARLAAEKAHAEALETVAKRHTEALAELTQKHERALIGEREKFAETERTHVAALSELERLHAETLSERDRAHAELLGEQGKRLETAQEALIAERDARAADAETSSLKLSGAQTEHREELAELARRHATALEEKERTHAEALRARETAFDEALTARDSANREALAAADRAHAAALDRRDEVHANALAEERAARAAENDAAHDANTMLVAEQSRLLEEKAALVTAHEEAIRRGDDALRVLEQRSADLTELQLELEAEQSARTTASAEHVRALAERNEQHERALAELVARQKADLAEHEAQKKLALEERERERERDRAAAAKALAAALEERERGHNEEIEERKRAHADEFAERAQKNLDELADMDRVHAEALAAERRARTSAAEAHARELAERDRAHAAIVAALTQKYDDIEQALASEFEARVTGTETRAQELAFEKKKREEERAAYAMRLDDLEHALASELEARVTDAAQHKELLAAVTAEKDEALRKIDEIAAAIEAQKLDLAQAQMDLSEESRARASDVARHQREIAALVAKHEDDRVSFDQNAVEEQAFTQQRVGDLERALVAERSELSASVAAHARDVASVKKLKEEIAAERAARTADAEAHAREVLALNQAAAAEQRLADSVAEQQAKSRDDAHALIAQLRSELASALAARDEEGTAETIPPIGGEVDGASAKIVQALQAQLAEAKRGLEIAERDAIKEELARDAAIADLQQQVLRERGQREAIERNYEAAIEAARDEALLQALSQLKAKAKK